MTNLQTTAWIRNPRLYKAAEEAAKTTPTGTRLYYKKTRDHYLRLGGQLEADTESEHEPGSENDRTASLD